MSSIPDVTAIKEKLQQSAVSGEIAAHYLFLGHLRRQKREYILQKT